MKDQSAVRIKYLRFTALYGIIMLCIIAFAVSKNSTPPVAEAPETVVEQITSTKVEYVYVRQEESETEAQVEEKTYTVKEYNEKICIFNADGSLFESLDTNIKSLPEADRRLLREGFEVIGRSQLNSIIEDYSE